ncbi:MAG: hypothetical protein ACK50U_18760 [Acidobacteriota bacterium]
MQEAPIHAIEEGRKNSTIVSGGLAEAELAALSVKLLVKLPLKVSDGTRKRKPAELKGRLKGRKL